MLLECYPTSHRPPEIVPGRPDRQWMDAFAARHPYRCLPLSMANTTGWDVLCPMGFTAEWDGGKGTDAITLTPDRPHPDFHEFVTSHFSHGVLTFHTGYLFRTKPGWDMWAGGPPNQPKDGIYPLTGLVETDWLPFPFTMNWIFTRPGRSISRRARPSASSIWCRTGPWTRSSRSSARCSPTTRCATSMRCGCASVPASTPAGPARPRGRTRGLAEVLLQGRDPRRDGPGAGRPRQQAPPEVGETGVLIAWPPVVAAGVLPRAERSAISRSLPRRPDVFRSLTAPSGRSSVVEHNLAKVGVESSNLFARSRKSNENKGLEIPLFSPS
jgi:hypothetical protein